MTRLIAVLIAVLFAAGLVHVPASLGQTRRTSPRRARRTHPPRRRRHEEGADRYQHRVGRRGGERERDRRGHGEEDYRWPSIQGQRRAGYEEDHVEGGIRQDQGSDRR